MRTISFGKPMIGEEEKRAVLDVLELNGQHSSQISQKKEEILQLISEPKK